MIKRACNCVWGQFNNYHKGLRSYVFQVLFYDGRGPGRHVSRVCGPLLDPTMVRQGAVTLSLRPLTPRWPNETYHASTEATTPNVRTYLIYASPLQCMLLAWSPKPVAKPPETFDNAVAACRATLTFDSVHRFMSLAPSNKHERIRTGGSR